MNNKLVYGVIGGLGIIIIVLSIVLVMVTRQKSEESSVSRTSPTPKQPQQATTAAQPESVMSDSQQTGTTTTNETCARMGQSQLRVSTNGVGIATVLHDGDTSNPVEARIYGSDATNIKQIDSRIIPAGADTIEFDLTVEPWMTYVTAVSCTDATPGSGIPVDRSITTEITPNTTTKSFNRDADDDISMCLGNSMYMAERDAQPVDQILTV